MALDGQHPIGGDEADLATRAAWLHFAGGLTQTEVAKRLHLTPIKAHRLIARATRGGFVHVFVDGPVGACIALENTLRQCFSLAFCRVTPDLGERHVPLRALGQAGAAFLLSVLDRGEHRVIGVGHGRTLAAMAAELPSRPAPGVRFVSLLGGLPRTISSAPFDVIYRLVKKTSAEADLMPVPFFAQSSEDRAVLLRQEGVAETLAAAAEATLFLVGIGEVTGGAFLPEASRLIGREVERLGERGAVGEVLGRYLDRNGRRLDVDLHRQVVGLDPEAMRGREAIAVAGGHGKVHAIRAVLRSGLLSGLITDEQTARRLVDLERGAEDGGAQMP